MSLMAVEIPSWLVSVALRFGHHLPWRRVFRRHLTLALTVRDIRAKKFRDKDGTVVYTMLQLWVANDTLIDAHRVRVTFNWKRHGSGTLHGHWNTDGLWLKKLASGMASYPGGVSEDVDLLSNGDEQHLGLIAKVPASKDGYIVAPRSYHAPEYPNYQHPDFALSPGTYDVDIAFTALGGRKGAIQLEVHQPGVGADPFGKVR